jgi:D-sedoheptulose 7-phosphate isomerase
MNTQYLDLLKSNMDASIQNKKNWMMDTLNLKEFIQAVEHVVEAYRRGGRLYIAGNGGSAADAQHLAAEFVSKLARVRNPLPAEALTTDSSILTSIGNDYGFDQVFARQLRAKITPQDVFLAITTSGNSPNILQALRECQLIGARSILFTGRDGGEAKCLADFVILAPGEKTSTIPEIHLVLEHTLCECVELALFPPARSASEQVHVPLFLPDLKD